MFSKNPLSEGTHLSDIFLNSPTTYKIKNLILSSPSFRDRVGVTLDYHTISILWRISNKLAPAKFTIPLCGSTLKNALSNRTVTYITVLTTPI